jgi:hypothetical protein
MRLIALKDLSLVVDDTGIVSKILMMVYIARYKSRFVALYRVSSRLNVCNTNVQSELSCSHLTTGNYPYVLSSWIS